MWTNQRQIVATTYFFSFSVTLFGRSDRDSPSWEEKPVENIVIRLFSWFCLNGLNMNIFCREQSPLDEIRWHHAIFPISLSSANAEAEMQCQIRCTGQRATTFAVTWRGDTIEWPIFTDMLSYLPDVCINAEIVVIIWVTFVWTCTCVFLNILHAVARVKLSCNIESKAPASTMQLLEQNSLNEWLFFAGRAPFHFLAGMSYNFIWDMSPQQFQIEFAVFTVSFRSLLLQMSIFQLFFTVSSASPPPQKT